MPVVHVVFVEPVAGEAIGFFKFNLPRPIVVYSVVHSIEHSKLDCKFAF